MLVDVNKLLLTEQKKPKYLTFSIKPKNKHNLTVYPSKPEASNLYTMEAVYSKHEKCAEHVIKGVYETEST